MAPLSEPRSHTPWQSVGFMLSTLGYAVSRGFHHALAPLDLEPRQFAVMRVIGLEEGQSQQALAQRLQIPKSRMVAIVDELEERGLLQRQATPSDRRVYALHLTAGGRKLLRRGLEVATSYEQQVSGSLDPEERDKLLDLLQRIAAALDLPGTAHSALHDGG
jgi:DNA-binding MarR family transcriptional regulator